VASKTTFLYLLLLSGVLRPEASTPLLCRLLLWCLLLCRLPHGYPLPLGIRRGHFPGLPNFPGAFFMLSLGDARGWSMPEVVDLKETPSCHAVLSSGSLSRCPTMLTLVNARGPYGTVLHDSVLFILYP